jgi:hypothetical protein
MFEQVLRIIRGYGSTLVSTSCYRPLETLLREFDKVALVPFDTRSPISALPCASCI